MPSLSTFFSPLMTNQQIYQASVNLSNATDLGVIALTVSYIVLDIPINTPLSSSHPEVNDGDHFSDDLSIDGETIACDPDDLSSSVSTLNSVNDQMERMTSQFLTPSGTSTYNFYKCFLDVA